MDFVISGRSGDGFDSDDGVIARDNDFGVVKVF